MENKDWQLPKFEKIEFFPKRTKYCLCIPVINEGEKIKKQLEKIKAHSALLDVIICDGGSTDGSLDPENLKALNVRCLLIKTDRGRLSAQLRMGYAYAMEEGYEGIITVDGNGKDDVRSLPSFIKTLDDGFDFVQGSRFVAGGQAINTPFLRLAAIKLIHAPVISLLSGFRYTDTTNGFRGYSRKLILDSKVQPFRDVFETYELLAYLSVVAPKLGFKAIEIPVTRKYPSKGKVPTKISPIKGNLKLIRILVGLIFKKYNPPTKKQ